MLTKECEHGVGTRFIASTNLGLATVDAINRVPTHDAIPGILELLFDLANVDAINRVPTHPFHPPRYTGLTNTNFVSRSP